MQRAGNLAETHVNYGVSQFELTKNILNNLSQFKLSPTAKLVLLYLTSCYNPQHAEIFPKQKTIALKVGISERSVVRAIQELFKAGLILVECKYTNRYKFTQKIASQCPANLSDSKRQNDLLKRDNLSHHDKEQIKEQKNNKESIKIMGGNVYSEEETILREYAIKHGARNINAYVSTLKSTNSANKIICEYKKKNFVAQRALYSIQETQNRIKEMKEYEKNAVSASNSEAWQLLGKKFGIKR